MRMICILCVDDGCTRANCPTSTGVLTVLMATRGVHVLEWIGVPDSAGLLEMGPGRWLHALSRDQAMDAAIQLHRDVC